jgi:hypothetical protein
MHTNTRLSPNHRVRLICFLLLWLTSVPLLINGGYMPTMLAYAFSDPPRYPVEAVIICCCITLLETGWIAWSLSQQQLGRRLAGLCIFVGWAVLSIVLGFGVSDAGGLPAAHALWLLLVVGLGGPILLLLGLCFVLYAAWQRRSAP